MADEQITNLAELGSEPASDDLFVIVDSSDTTMSANGTDKKLQYTTVRTALDGRYLVLDGISGGQTASGGTDGGDDLILNSTTNGTKGTVQLAGGLVYLDEAIQQATIAGNTASNQVIIIQTEDDSLNNYLLEFQDSNGDLTLAIAADGDVFTDRWLGSNTNLFLGMNVASAGNLAHGSGTEGWYNTYLGLDSGAASTTCTYNVGLGADSLESVLSGSYNMAIGGRALNYLTTGSSNMAIGYGAFERTTEGEHNVGIGSFSGRWIQDGDYNICIGRLSGGYAIGAAITGADYNICIGGLAGYNLTSSKDGNVFIGYAAGQNNTGAKNVMIGFSAGAAETGSNKLYIAHTNTTTPLIYGAFDGAGAVGVIIHSPLAASVPLTIRGTTSQSADLQQWQTVGGAATVGDVSIDGAATFASFVRNYTSNYRRYYHLPITSFDPGASGATWVSADANTLSGWGLDAAGETLEFNSDVHADWDEVTDLNVEITFTVNVDNSGGGAGDTVDLQLICYYKGEGDEATKSQTLEDAIVVGACNQWTQFNHEFTINYDEVDNVVEVGDRVSFILNLETDTSEVDDITINDGSFYYQTTHTGIESGDT